MPDTGQKIVAPVTYPGGGDCRATSEPPAKHRSVLMPILMGTATVVVLVVIWWRISARPVVEKPPESAPVAVATPVATSQFSADRRKPSAAPAPIIAKNSCATAGRAQADSTRNSAARKTRPGCRAITRRQ